MKNISLLALFFAIFSCSPKMLRKPVYSTTVFRGERGEKEVNIYNKIGLNEKKTWQRRLKKLTLRYGY